jgi:hypothetical protein
MIGQLKSFKQQLDLATQIKGNIESPAYSAAKLPHKNTEQVLLSNDALSTYELDILNEFLTSKLFEFDVDGKMYSASSIRKGTSLSSEGFKQAIEKLLNQG